MWVLYFQGQQCPWGNVEILHLLSAHSYRQSSCMPFPFPASVAAPVPPTPPILRLSLFLNNQSVKCRLRLGPSSHPQWTGAPVALLLNILKNTPNLRKFHFLVPSLTHKLDSCYRSSTVLRNMGQTEAVENGSVSLNDIVVGDMLLDTLYFPSQADWMRFWVGMTSEWYRSLVGWHQQETFHQKEKCKVTGV